MGKPKIRFKGYTTDWEQRKLLGCIKKITDFRGRTPKKLGMDWSENGYLALSALNVKDGYIDFSQDVHYGDQELYDKWMSGNELHKGQVLFTTEAPMGNVAQVPDNKRYILSQRTIAFDVKDDIITENFLATLLRSPSVFNTLTSLSSGGTAKGVSQKSLAGVDVQIPIDLREQTLLADYFHSLDHLITLHQRKYEEVKILKKYMLQKMFPQSGQKVPEIRFAGFTEDWEQRKLGELAEIGDIDHRMPETVADGIPYLMTGDFVGTNELNFDGTKMISEEDYCQLSQKIKPEKGDILFARYASVGAARYVDFTRKFLISYSCAIIKKSKKINSKYLYYFITSDNAQQQIKLEINTGSQANIGIDSMKNHIMVSMPPLEEQTKIADVLSNLDYLITLHQQECEELKNIKKFMLQNMFV